MSEQLKEVCAYIRVSTDKQEELSPDSQIRLIKEYAQAHNMLITRIYKEDKGISGKNANKRPAFQEMIAACKDKSHPYDAILLWKFSRFARNIDESTYYKSVLRKKCNVDVISISEPIVEGMYGRLIEMVIEWSDEFYLYNLSGEVMRGMTQKALKGGYNANAPIGYIKEKGSEHIPQVDPDTAPIVQNIFNMFTEKQYPMSDIAARLNKSGYKTKRGGRFEQRTIRYILENPFYIGKVRWNYYDRQNNKRKDPNDVILADGEHDPIVSEEQFGKAAKRLAELRKRSSYGKHRTAVSAGHWLSGLLKCPACGASLGYHRKMSKRSACFLCWKNAKGLCDTKTYIGERQAVEEVMHVLEDMAASDQEFYYDLSVITEDKTERSMIQKELHSLENKMKRIKDAYINEIDTLEEYKENKAILIKRQEELQVRLEQSQKVSRFPARRKNINLQLLMEQLKDESIETADKANALREIFDCFIWDNEKKELQVVLNQNIKSE